MSWYLILNFRDGRESEPLYCTNRREARDRARQWRRSMTDLVSARVYPVGK